MSLPTGIDDVVATLEPGGRLLTMQQLTGGVSATVLGIEIETTAGGTRRAVVRQHRNPDFKDQLRQVTAKEHGVLVALDRAGLAVPEPYLLDDSDTFTDPYLVVEWVDGSTEVSADELPVALDQMAEFLVAIHALDVGALGVDELEPIEDPATAVVDYLPSSATGERIRRLLPTIDPDPGPGRQALIHGDYWPGNVLWRAGRLIAVIDWEDACVGDPLADLATARVELLCQYGAEAMERFTTSYRSQAAAAGLAVSFRALPIWEVYSSASALATMHGWGLEPAEEAHRRQRTEDFLDRAVDDLAASATGPPSE